jgi:hypothetical protein
MPLLVPAGYRIELHVIGTRVIPTVMAIDTGFATEADGRLEGFRHSVRFMAQGDGIDIPQLSPLDSMLEIVNFFVADLEGLEWLLEEKFLVPFLCNDAIPTDLKRLGKLLAEVIRNLAEEGRTRYAAVEDLAVGDALDDAIKNFLEE